MEPTLRDQPDLRSLLRALWRRKWLFLGIFLTIPIVVYAISTQVAKTYEATTLLRIKTPSFDIAALAPGSLSAVETEALLAETDKVAEEAAKELKLPESSAGSLISAVRVEPIAAANGGVTELVQLTASAEQAPRAAEIANAYARALDTVRSTQALRQIDRATSSLKAQSRGNNDPATQAELARQLQLLRAARAGARENTETIQPATVPADPISPHPRRNAALAALVSLLLALGALTVVERLDRRLRDSSELESLLGAPLLSVIPRAAFPGAKPSPGPVREAFRTLSSSLIYFNVDRPLSTVVVTSPTQGDGKTTVAVNLAGALAKDGQNVALIDCDLRHPQVSLRLGIEPPGGVAEVVTDQATLEDSIVQIDVSETGDGRLQVLGSGRRPPNPGGLLGSERMASLLVELTEIADIVIVDTPPILNVSDAIPLLERVSGVVIVAQVGHTGRDALLRTRQVLETARGSILGGVATGSTEAGLYGYGTEYYAADLEADADADAVVAEAQSSAPPVAEPEEAADEPAAPLEEPEEPVKEPEEPGEPEEPAEQAAGESEARDKEAVAGSWRKEGGQIDLAARYREAEAADAARDREQEGDDYGGEVDYEDEYVEPGARTGNETVEWSAAELDAALASDDPLSHRPSARPAPNAPGADDEAEAPGEEVEKRVRGEERQHERWRTTRRERSGKGPRTGA